jgi:phosphatidate cytidylyltransferase
MAFNWQTFRTRALTALIFVAVMLTGLLWNHWSFFILFSVIHFGCWMEYQKLVGLIDPDYNKISPFHKYGVMIAGWSIMLSFTNNAYSLAGFRLYDLGWWPVFVFFIGACISVLFVKQSRLKNIGHSFFGLLYISLSLSLMISLRSRGMVFKGESLFLDFGRLYPCLLIFSIWINDTMAYIVGSLIGKTPLSKISPKKTWEGTTGGAVLAIIVMAWLGPIVVGGRTIPVAIIAAIAAVTGTFGDLLESKLKRMANVKDSGHIMPGHGGFLDRFDSLLLSIPFVWLYIYLFV